MRPSWPGFGLRSGDVHFSQDHSHPPPPPILHPAALQWSERAERSSFKQINESVLCLAVEPTSRFAVSHLGYCSSVSQKPFSAVDLQSFSKSCGMTDLRTMLEISAFSESRDPAGRASKRSRGCAFRSPPSGSGSRPKSRTAPPDGGDVCPPAGFPFRDPRMEFLRPSGLKVEACTTG